MQNIQKLKNMRKQNALLELQIQNQRMQMEQARKNLIEQNRNQMNYPANSYVAPAPSYRAPAPVRPKSQNEEESHPRIKYITGGGHANGSSQNQPSQFTSPSRLIGAGEQPNGTVEEGPLGSQEISKITHHNFNGKKITCTTIGNVTECK